MLLSKLALCSPRLGKTQEIQNGAGEKSAKALPPNNFLFLPQRKRFFLHSVAKVYLGDDLEMSQLFKSNWYFIVVYFFKANT